MPILLALSQHHLCLKVLDRPDACKVTANGEVLPLEVTVCHELNFEKARDYTRKNDTVTS